MSQEDNQSGQKSSFDRVKDTANKARSAYNNVKNVKNLKRTYRTIRAAQTLLSSLSITGWAIVAALIMVVASTFFIAMIGGGPGVNAGIPEEPPPTTNTDCSPIEIPGLECAIDAPTHVENGETYNYRFYGSYIQQEGGAELNSFTIKLTIPHEVIEFTTNLPGNFDTDVNGDLTTFTWLLTDEVNERLFTLEENSNPPKYTFDFSVTARPKQGVVDTIASVEFIIYGDSPPSGGDGQRCTVGSTNTCGGKYESDMSKNPDGLNFGDPNCELTTGGTINKQMVRDEIKRQLSAYGKTKDYCRWSCIATFESGYNPNSFNGNAPGPQGAWGMFQMSPHACISPSRGTTGNVTWRQQITNALKRNYTVLEGAFTYWSVYKHTCYVQPDWSSGIPCKTVRDHIIE